MTMTTALTQEAIIQSDYLFVPSQVTGSNNESPGSAAEIPTR